MKVIEQSSGNDNGGNADGANTSGLEFKTSDMNESQPTKNNVVLCSSNKTWLLRQKNHSNTVLLMKEFKPEKEIVLPENLLFGKNEQPTLNLLGFSKTTYEYETKPIQGKINLDLIPIYDGELNFGKDNNNGSTQYLKSINELMDNSACSREECLNEWYRIGGCTINGYICLFSESFMTKALHVTLVSILDGSLDMNKLDLEETFKLVTKDIDEDYNPYTLEVIRTVLNKFGIRILKEDSRDKNVGDVYWKLNMELIAKWYGKQALMKYASQHSVPNR